MDWTGLVGENRAGVGDGADDRARIGKTGELILGKAHGNYYEAASRGQLYSASTAVAGVAPGTALSTTPPLVLWNAPGSGLLIAVKKLIMGYVSGTLGAGHLWIATVAQASAPSGGTELTPVCLLAGAGLRSRARAFQGSTVSATPTAYRSTGIILGAFAGAADTPVPPVIDDMGGEIVLAPGNALCVQGQAGAGTSPLVTLGFVFEECPYT